MRDFDVRKLILRLLGIFGTALFAFFFALTFHTPVWIERFAADFIEREASRQVDRKIDALQPPGGEAALSRMAAALYERNQAELERQRELLRSRAHERMADALAEIRNLDCECRARLAESGRERTEARIELLQRGGERLTGFIHATYAQVVADLKRDIRIFTGTNALVFLALLLVSFAKPRATVQLFVPGLMLAVATVICSYFYIFEQNWLLTIIYSNYLGLAYLGYLALVFAFLCDIALNRARVTTAIVNAILEALGRAATAAPC